MTLACHRERGPNRIGEKRAPTLGNVRPGGAVSIGIGCPLKPQFPRSNHGRCDSSGLTLLPKPVLSRSGNPVLRCRCHGEDVGDEGDPSRP